MKKYLLLLITFLFFQNIFSQQIIKAKDVRIIISNGTIVNASGGITLTGTSLLKNDGTINLIPSILTKEHWLDSTATGAMDITSVGLVHFNSDSLQKIYGNTKFYNTRINVDSGVLLETNSEVRNVLQIDQGFITTGTNVLLVSNPNTNAIQSSSGFTKSWVNGKLARLTNISNVDYLYPIGKIMGTDTIYAPVYTDKSNNTNATYTTEYFKNPPIDFTNFMNPPIQRVSQLEYWTIESSNFSLPADDDARITLSYRASSIVNNSQAVRDSLMIAQYTSTPQWEPTGGGFPAIAVSTASPSFGLIKHNSTVNAFNTVQHNFTLASRSLFNILPYRVVSWSAIKNNQSIQLNWSVEFDMDVLQYQIEKSIDGIQYSLLNTQTSLQRNLSFYNTIDYAPAKGWNYYKLKVVDKNGQIVLVGIRKIWSGDGVAQMSLYPNPAHHFIQLQLPTYEGKSILYLYDATGKLISTYQPTGNNIQINIEKWKAGIYYLKLIQGNYSETTHFMKY